MTFKQAWNRRSFLSMLSAASLGLAGAAKLRASSGAAKRAGDGGYLGWPDGNPNRKVTLTGLGSSGDICAELGVTPIINARGTITGYGGSLMPPEVQAMMRMASSHFVVIDDLERAGGRYIAKMLKLPAGYSALITSGAAGALLAGWAGVLTGDNREWIRQIPDVSGMAKSEVILQRRHRYPFDHQIRQTGAKLVLVDTREELLAAINPRTAGMHFLNLANGAGQIKVDEWAKIANAHQVPCFNDAAADTPPVSRLWEYVNLGYDLVTFSGGKDIRGPQCAGLLLGKQPLLDSALLNMSPQEDTIARPCKVGKEEIFGMIKALELFLASDQEALTQSYYARMGIIADAVKKFPSVETSYKYNQGPIMNRSPFVNITWDPGKLKITAREVLKRLEATQPWPIHAIGGGGRRRDGTVTPPTVSFTCWQLKPGEEQIIADRMTEIFKGAGV